MYLFIVLIAVNLLTSIGKNLTVQLHADEATTAALQSDVRAARSEDESTRAAYRESLQRIVRTVYQRENYGTGGYGSGVDQNINELYQAIMNGVTDYSALLKDTEDFFNTRSRISEGIPSIWPVKFDSTIRITSGFGYRIYPIDGKIDFHRGIDIAGAWKTTILATADGVVTEVTAHHPLYGRMVRIRHADGFATLYAHMESTRVAVGQSVKQGQVIGIMGDTGEALGRHLHYEVTKDGRLVNPIRYLTSNHQLTLSPDPAE